MKMYTLFLVILILVGCTSENVAIEEDVLVVYAPHPIEFIDPIIAEFENSTGITVEVVRAGTGELLSRIEHEIESEVVVGDVLWGGSLATLESKKELFQKYYSINEEHISYKNGDGYITRFTLIPSVIMINTNLEGDTEIDGYSDLLQESLKGKIAFADPSVSASSYEQLLNQLWAMGEGDPIEGWHYVEHLIIQIDGELLDSSSKVYNGVAEGEYVVGLTFEEAAAKFVANGAPIRIVYPEEGTIIRPDGVSIIKGCDNIDGAKAFVDFVTSYEIQAYISSELNRRSVRDDVPKSNSLTSYEDIYVIEDDKNWSSVNKEDIISNFTRLYRMLTNDEAE